MRRSPVALAALVSVLALAAVTPARADSITVRGSSIAMTRCRIIDIKLGRVYFRDGTSRRRWRDIDEVAIIGFAGLPELDEAETRLAAGDSQTAVRKLLLALIGATSEVQELWVRVRLAQVHDERGDFVEASGHVAAVVLLREESYWRRLAPSGEANRPSYAAAKEARDALRRARRELTSPDLYAMVDRLARVVEPVYDELARTYDGPDLREGSTRSGHDLREILRWRAADARGAPAPSPGGPGVTGDAPSRSPRGRDKDAGVAAGGATAPRTAAPPRPQPAAPARAPAPVPAPEPAPPPPSDDEPDTIDRLLEAGRGAEALGLCERVARRPGRRSLARFLHQYGRALAAEGRSREAAVMLARSAILYPTSAFAAPSLLEAAIIYRDHYGNHAGARRLADRAFAIASREGQDAVAERVREVRSTLEPISGG